MLLGSVVSSCFALSFSLGGVVEVEDKLLSNEENLNLCFELEDEIRLALLLFSSGMMELERELLASSLPSSSLLPEFMILFNNELLFLLNLGLIGCANGGTFPIPFGRLLAWNPL